MQKMLVIYFKISFSRVSCIVRDSTEDSDVAQAQLLSSRRCVWVQVLPGCKPYFITTEQDRSRGSGQLSDLGKQLSHLPMDLTAVTHTPWRQEGQEPSLWPWGQAGSCRQA